MSRKMVDWRIVSRTISTGTGTPQGGAVSAQDFVDYVRRVGFKEGWEIFQVLNGQNSVEGITLVVVLVKYKADAAK